MLRPRAPHHRAFTVDWPMIVAGLLTAGQTFWWHNDEAHRSVFSFVMTVVWLGAMTVVMTRPLQRAWAEVDEIDRRRKAVKKAGAQRGR